MSITVSGTGAVMIDGRESVALYRLFTLRAALRLEAAGLKRRGPSALSIVKQEFGLKGSRAKVTEQFEAFVDDCKRMHAAGEGA